MKILVFGLPRQGKTVLAEKLAKELKAVHFNADFIRQHINKDLGFSYTDRIEQSRRMEVLCNLVTKSGTIAIADFVCPTVETRKVFNADYTIYINTGHNNPFIDTQLMFQHPSPEEYDIMIENWDYDIDFILRAVQLKE